MSAGNLANPFNSLRNTSYWDRGQRYGYAPSVALATQRAPGEASSAVPQMPSAPTANEVYDDSFRNENQANQRAHAGSAAAVKGAMGTFDPSKASPEDIAAARKSLGAVDAGDEYRSRQMALAQAQNELDDHARKYGFSSAAIQRAMGDQKAGDSSDGKFVAEVQAVQERMKNDKAFADWSRVHSQALDKASAEFAPLEARGKAPGQPPPANPTGDTSFPDQGDSKSPAQRLKGSTYLTHPQMPTQLIDGTAEQPNVRGQEYKGALLDPASPQMVSQLRLIAAGRAREGYDASPEAKGYQDQARQAQDALVAGKTVRGLQEQRTTDARDAETFADESALRQSQAAGGFAAANRPTVASDDMGTTTVTPPATTFAPRPLMPSARGPGYMPGGPQYAPPVPTSSGIAPPPPAAAAQPAAQPAPQASAAPPPAQQPSGPRHWWERLYGAVTGMNGAGPSATAPLPPTAASAPPPQLARAPHAGAKIDPATAQKFLVAAKGDRNAARQMAAQYGWSF